MNFEGITLPLHSPITSKKPPSPPGSASLLTGKTWSLPQLTLLLSEALPCIYPMGQSQKTISHSLEHLGLHTWGFGGFFGPQFSQPEISFLNLTADHLKYHFRMIVPHVRAMLSVPLSQRSSLFPLSQSSLCLAEQTDDELRYYCSRERSLPDMLLPSGIE